jgi:hypothetical protein
MQILFAALALLYPTHAHAWGAVGHRTVAHVAEAKLSSDAQALVKNLLGKDSLADVANWADSLRSGDGYKQTIWYHFEKIPDGTSYLDNLKALPDWQKKKGGVVAAILLANKILRDGNRKAEQTDALKFLVHFVGDLHQPLHTGRPEDNGGVKVPIEWQGQSMSLHHLWDTGLLDSAHPDFLSGHDDEADSQAYAKFLLARTPQTPADPAMDVEGWLDESLALRAAAYDKLVDSNPKAYLARHAPEVDQRLYAAGVRLAQLLNDIAARARTPQLEQDLLSHLEAAQGAPLEQLISFKP